MNSHPGSRSPAPSLLLGRGRFTSGRAQALPVFVQEQVAVPPTTDTVADRNTL
jgi:hypothetical protein